jgi:hypothetical protein
VAAPGDWVDAPSGTFTTNPSLTYDDTLDNQIIYYRIGFKTGEYTSGTANVSLSSPSGSQTGIARITAFSSSTSVSAAILTAFGATTATSDWSESYWSTRRGYPSSVAFYEGRLWWAGKDRVWGSVSDGFDNFDDTTVGDSGPISRSSVPARSIRSSGCLRSPASCWVRADPFRRFGPRLSMSR